MRRIYNGHFKLQYSKYYTVSRLSYNEWIKYIKKQLEKYKIKIK